MTRKFQRIDSSSAMVFDGSVADTWEVRMVGSVLSPRTRLISPGRLYTFIIKQIDVSNRFVWPASCRNAPTVNPEPDSTTTANFIGLVGGILQAVPPGATLEVTPIPTHHM